MIHEMKLREEYFDKIKQGQKIYEIRLNDEKRRLISIGDVILFNKLPNLTEKLQVLVEDLLHFKSFKEMAHSLPLQEVGFENLSKDEVEKIYHKFYSLEDEKKYGVLAIKIKLVGELWKGQIYF